jgi:type IV pilus assembly protein PilC
MRVRKQEEEVGIGSDTGVAVLEPESGVAVLMPSSAKGRSRLQRVMQFELTPKRVPRKDLMHFSRQLAVFIQSGIPITEALEIISSETSNKQFKEIQDDILKSIESGSTFADAAAHHQKAFPPYYMGILRAAELTGNLDTVLVRLSEYIERDLEARRKVVSALTYPAIIAVLAVVVVGVLVGFVLPRFETFFSDLNAKLPLPTRMLLSMAHFLHHWWFLFVGVGVLLIAAGVWLQQVEQGRRIRDKMLLRLPVLGDVVRHAVLERFCRILSSMMSAGVPLPESLKVASEATGNRVYIEALATAREQMIRGAGLAAPLADTGLFPTAARQMFRVGESTGSLDSQLETAAAYFDRELDYKVKRFTNLFEPAVILAMGFVVGFVAIALISAMYGIFRQTHVS